MTTKVTTPAASAKSHPALLYYVEAYSLLSETRERISAYCTNRHLAEALLDSFLQLPPDELPYQYPLVASCPASDVVPPSRMLLYHSNP